jgi:hypothetical protein
MAGGELDSGMIDEIRSAFASGNSATGEELLLAALEAGMPWDVATRAVAEGVASHFGRPVPSDRLPRGRAS